jgi:hypothetical protein
MVYHTICYLPQQGSGYQLVKEFLFFWDSEVQYSVYWTQQLDSKLSFYSLFLRVKFYLGLIKHNVMRWVGEWKYREIEKLRTSH